MSVVTVSWTPLKKDAVLPDRSVYKDLAKPKGMLGAYSGKPTDASEPPALELVNIWESVDAANAAQASPDGQKIKADLEALVETSDPALKAHHNVFVFATDFAPVADAPITQQTIIFAPLSVNQAEFTAAWEEALKSGPTPDGFIAGTYGWAEAEIDQPPHVGTGKAKAFLASAGWESIEKANAGREASKAYFAPLSKFGVTAELTHSRFTTLTKIPDSQ